MHWLARRRYEGLALVVALLSAGLHLATAVPRVLGDDGTTLLDRAAQAVEGRLWDLKFRLRGPVAPHPDVVVMTIDERSAQAWGQWPWSRRHFAAALERLADANVAAVGLDVTFTDARDEEEREARATLARLSTLPATAEVEAWRAELDAQLAKTPDAALEAAMRRLGPTLVQGVIPITRGDRRDYSAQQLASYAGLVAPHLVRAIRSPQGFERTLAMDKLDAWTLAGLQAPLPRFANAGTAMGHFGATLDADGTIRRSAIWVRVVEGDGLFPSMALRTAATALGATLNPLVDDGALVGAELLGPAPRRVHQDALSPFLPIDYPGPASAFTSYSVVDVVEGRVGKAELSGKAVLVGVTIVGSSGDQRVTPFKELEGGVYTHAAVLSNILSGRFLSRPSWALLLEVLGTLLLALALGVTIPRVRFMAKALLIVGAVGGWVVASYLAFLGGVQLAIATPVLGLLVTAFGVVFLGYLSVDREKLKMRSTFSRYLGEDVIEIAIENPERLNKGEKREMTVLFSDIRGFTTLSERMTPELLATFINEYLSPMTAIVFDEKGTLDKYIGDALMAFWNAPLDQPDHALRACRAAVKMLEKLDALKQQWREAGYPELEIGIGVNSGPMVVGNMGSDVRVDYTVLGDAVNLGSRLEGTNKEYDTRIIISESTWAQAKDELVCRRLGAVRVKGKRLPVGIYELRGLGKPSEADAAVIATFEAALTHFTARRFDEAREAFVRVLQAWPTDMATRRYLAQLETFKAQPPPSDWDGVASLTTK